ncbi:hypothetical protein [Bradyrhizobium septentrionale]|uniref:Uncharacterized protein n=1 Tax=Bradyrhizobium septentrionale TaxID=1404411 RepID=A0A973W325_9BRAD|nr:hypothetical protein [Bradyrhizobium septentrionale]UGY14976.1 hypothetical protein HAP48_0041685 [Bradyrhizobium septentrionale]UGY23579.1 hypothetical protein HU675_0037425 [Bradyrhizobium septentrionale]
MRSALMVGLLAMLWSAAADAATAHHRRVRQHVIVRPGEQVAPPGHYVYPGYGPIPPGENRNLDPSTRGGG